MKPPSTEHTMLKFVRASVGILSDVWTDVCFDICEVKPMAHLYSNEAILASKQYSVIIIVSVVPGIRQELFCGCVAQCQAVIAVVQ